MNAISILYAGNLSTEAYEPLLNNKNSVDLATEQAKKFPGVTKTVLLEERNWTKRSLLEKIAELSVGFDFAYFAFADCPFLDPSLAGAIAERHTQYAAEYSYADGYPAGLAPEILAPGTAAILTKILGDGDGSSEPVERDILFSVIQKDINAFDIETEISPVDLRCHRINLCADSKRNLLLLKNFIAVNGNIPDASNIEKIIAGQPQILRTLPAFYPIQAYGGCPRECAAIKDRICPYPLTTDVTARKDFMKADQFESLLDKIIAFSGDAVIDLSLWGELSLHPDKLKLIEAVVSRGELALVIETSGIGWKEQELEKYAALSAASSAKKPRKNSLAPLSWIVTPDSAEADACAKKLFSLFPKDCYVQSIRTKGSEDDTEKFFRSWKQISPNGEKNIIIQKYDDFCGFLEKRQASDISPVIRQPCRHIMRDFPVLIDGTVPLCKEDVKNEKRKLGNVFTDSLESIWKNGERYYIEHCKKNYTEKCLNCDEYYTYNF